MKINNISVTPLKKYAPPKYPTQTNASHEPELLLKLPSSWQKNTAVIAATGFLGVMSLTSCGTSNTALQGPAENIQYSTAPATVPQEISGNAQGYTANYETTVSQEPAEITQEYNEIQETTAGSDYSGSLNYLNVAPLFIHGEGTGSIACMMVVPPVFMSEQEALAVIKNIAEDAGLNFSAVPPRYTATQNKGTDPNGWINEDYVLGDGRVGLDLYDSENQVAVAYISMREAVLNYVDQGVPRISSTSFHPRELAKLTTEDFARQKGDINIGVLYEPGKSWEGEEEQRLYEEYRTKMNEVYEKYINENGEFIDEERIEEYYNELNEVREEYEEAVKVIIAENLRAQVRDFIEWLQGQGII